MAYPPYNLNKGFSRPLKLGYYIYTKTRYFKNLIITVGHVNAPTERCHVVVLMSVILGYIISKCYNMLGSFYSITLLYCVRVFHVCIDTYLSVCTFCR